LSLFPPIVLNSSASLPILEQILPCTGFSVNECEKLHNYYSIFENLILLETRGENVSVQVVWLRQRVTLLHEENLARFNCSASEHDFGVLVQTIEKANTSSAPVNSICSYAAIFFTNPNTESLTGFTSNYSSYDWDSTIEFDNHLCVAFAKITSKLRALVTEVIDDRRIVSDSPFLDTDDRPSTPGLDMRFLEAIPGPAKVTFGDVLYYEGACGGSALPIEPTQTLLSVIKEQSNVAEISHRRCLDIIDNLRLEGVFQKVIQQFMKELRYVTFSDTDIQTVFIPENMNRLAEIYQEVVSK
jgi:hypothetical protein